MTVLFTDSFTRADSSSTGTGWVLSIGWTDQLGILSNQASEVNLGNRAGSQYTAITWPNDHYSKALCVTNPAFFWGVKAREVTSGTLRNYYSAGQDDNDFGGGITTTRLMKEVANVVSSLGTGTAGMAAGKTITCQTQGTTITMFVNGVQDISVTDSSLASGAAGLGANHSVANVAMFDDFEGGDLNSVTSKFPLPRIRPAAPGSPLWFAWITRPRVSVGQFVNLVSYSYAPSGGLIFGGTAPVLKGKVYPVSGGITFGGAAPVLKGKVYPVSGGIVFGGAAPVLKGKVYPVSGGFVLGGAAPVLKGKVYPVSGGFVFGGTAPVLKGKVYTVSGGLNFGGGGLSTYTFSGNPAPVFSLHRMKTKSPGLLMGS